MKKTFYHFIVFCMFLLVLVGCNNNNGDSTASDEAIVSSENSDIVQLPFVTWTDDVENTDRQK